MRPGRDLANHLERLVRGVEITLQRTTRPPDAPQSPVPEPPLPRPSAGAQPKAAGPPATTPPPATPAHKAPAGARPAADLPPSIVNSIGMKLILIPAGEFLMGSDGAAETRPRHKVKITKPFYLGAYPVTQEEYERVMGTNPSCFAPGGGGKGKVSGLDTRRFPVQQVSWDDAVEFCRKLSALPQEVDSGSVYRLPTEAEWEYACRAGAATPFWYGGPATDFSRWANLADAKLSDFALHPYTEDQPLPNPSKYDDWIPKDVRCHDGSVIAVPAGRYPPNPWGLSDLHGNVAEWTRSLFWPYPYDDPDGRNDRQAAGRRVVRGGSWRDRPYRATASFRLGYEPFQKVFNVGFRVVSQ